jgi:hypothetical protein
VTAYLPYGSRFDLTIPFSANGGRVTGVILARGGG